MLVNVNFGNSTNGAWLQTKNGQVAIYTDKKSGPCVVIGYYDFKKEKNNMPIALVFNKNGEVILQKCTDGKYTFQELDPIKVAKRIEAFLVLLEDYALKEN